MSARSGGTLAVVALAAAAAAAALLVSRDDSDAARVVVPAIESEQAAALAAQNGIALSDFWARAKAMGVAAAIVRPQSLDDAMRRGEILRFDRDEVERWKAAGLLPPSTTLKPDTFWTKDQRLYEQLLQAVTSEGLAPTTTTLAGYHVVQVPEGSAELELRGYDPDRVAALDGVVPVYAEPSGLPARVGLTWRGASVVGETGAAASEAAELALEPVSWRVGSARSALLRLSLGRPRRLLVLTLDASLGLERSFTEARAALRALEAAGAPLSVPSRPPPAPSAGGLSRALALLAAWILGVLGPLFAARGGLLVLRRARLLALERWPMSSPVFQIAAGLLATTAFAAAAGLVVHALGALSGEPLPARWAAATLVGPLVIAVLTLYTIDLEAWAAALEKPATYDSLLRLALLALAAAALLAPRWLLHRLGLWLPLRLVAGHVPAVWWWPWRWREMLLGVPALVQALFLINWRLDCPDCASLPVKPANDPRNWFLLGLLAPIGVVSAVGRGAAPEMLALLHTAATLAVGTLLGAAGVAARLRAAHEHHGTGAPASSRPKGPVHV